MIYTAEGENTELDWLYSFEKAHSWYPHECRLSVENTST